MSPPPSALPVLRTVAPLRARLALRLVPCRASTVHLRLQLLRCDAREPLAAVAIISLGGRTVRWQSTSNSSNGGSGGRGSNDNNNNNNNNNSSSRQPKGNLPPKQRLSARILLRAVIGSFRSLFTPFRGQTLRALFRSNPEELVFALAILVAFVFIFAYIFRIYFTYFYSEQFTRYPAPIAKSLRRALYFSNYSPDPKRALRYYKLALEQCEQFHLDPFSDDVMGIKIQLAAWLEKVQSYDSAIRVLEALLADCKRWVEVMEKNAKEGTAPTRAIQAVRPLEPLKVQGDASSEEAPPETLWGKRSRILGKAIGISVKLGQLYADEHVLKPEAAHERLMWSVETALGEMRRRAVEGTKEGEGEWMNSEQIGGALEALAHSYESRSQFDLALPLFFQALRLCKDPCHSAVLMNNLAVSFAQHPIRSPGESPIETLQPTGSDAAVPSTQTRSAYLESAQRWAFNAHQHATETAGEARTSECDEACAVSLCNLGDIAALLGDFVEARRRFEQGLEMSKKLDFQAGVSQAEAGLRHLSK